MAAEKSTPQDAHFVHRCHAGPAPVGPSDVQPIKSPSWLSFESDARDEDPVRSTLRLRLALRTSMRSKPSHTHRSKPGALRVWQNSGLGQGSSSDREKMALADRFSMNSLRTGGWPAPEPPRLTGFPDLVGIVEGYVTIDFSQISMAHEIGSYFFYYMSYFTVFTKKM